MYTGEKEIIPLLEKEYPTIHFREYTASLGEIIPKGGFNLGFKISPTIESSYESVNKDLKGVYDKIEAEYGIQVSGFQPVYYFSQ